MKIVEIVPSLIPLGGAENLVLQLSKEFSYSNNDVYIISLYNSNNDFLLNFASNNNVKVIFLNKKKGIDFNCASDLKETIEEIRPDICHLHLNTYLTFFLTLSFKQQINYYTFHTFLSKNSLGNRLKPINILLSFMIKRRIIKPVAISKCVNQSILNYFKFKSIRLPTIMNGIDVKKFKYNSSLNRKYTFISVGRFEDVKNNLFMIKCFAALKEKYPHISYVICGNGKNFADCIKYCNDNHIEDIVFTDFVNNVEKYLRDSSCLLMASLWEGNPLVINEAISCGTWVIANNVGGIPDLVNDNNGYLVDDQSIESFTERMALFLNNQPLCYAKIKQNIIDAREDCSIHRCASEYLLLFEKH